jgi:hypothetical protein
MNQKNMLNKDIILHVCDDFTLNQYIKCKYYGIEKFLWVVNPSDLSIKTIENYKIDYFKNKVSFFESLSLSHDEYNNYMINIRFKAINRILFLNANSVIFSDSCNIPEDYKLNTEIDVLYYKNKFKNFLYVKNNKKTKAFFYNFEDYLMFEKKIKNGRNLFSSIDLENAFNEIKGDLNVCIK